MCARPRSEAPVPSKCSVFKRLKAVAPKSADEPLLGSKAIKDWLVRYGITNRDGGPPAWRTITGWNARGRDTFEGAGGMLFHTFRSGPCKGMPKSSHFLMLSWWVSIAPYVLGPRWSKYRRRPRFSAPGSNPGAGRRRAV